MTSQGKRFYVETLGCPKNQVDSDKLIGTLLADGMLATDSAEDADLVVVNTCAFIDEARRESIDRIKVGGIRREDDADTDRQDEWAERTNRASCHRRNIGLH